MRMRTVLFPIAAHGPLRGTPDGWGAVRLDLRVDESKAIAFVVVAAPDFGGDGDYGGGVNARTLQPLQSSHPIYSPTRRAG